MAVRKDAQKDQSESLQTTADPIEQRVVAFAEQLGWLIANVQTKTEGWLDRKTLSKEIGRIRDGAVDLLDQVDPKTTRARKPAATRPASPTARLSRGPVDAPGKRHRKPPPQETLDKRIGEPRGKKMGQKGARNTLRGGRR